MTQALHCLRTDSPCFINVAILPLLLFGVMVARAISGKPEREHGVSSLLRNSLWVVCFGEAGKGKEEEVEEKTASLSVPLFCFYLDLGPMGEEPCLTLYWCNVKCPFPQQNVK